MLINSDIKIETEEQIKNLPFIEFNTIQNDNKAYNIKIYLDEKKNSLLFYAKSLNDLIEMTYKKEYTKNNLQEIEFFNNFKEIKKIFECLKIIVNEKDKEIIIIENGNKIEINIKFEYHLLKEEINFKLDCENVKLFEVIKK